MPLADAVKRAAAAAAGAAKPKEEVVKIDPFEIAAEELTNAKTPGERAEALRAFAELARLQK